MDILDGCIKRKNEKTPIPFEEFLALVLERPEFFLRNIFQVFHDMVKAYVVVGKDEYGEDPESIGFLDINCSALFVEGVDSPFFADRLFANRLIKLVEALKRGTQQNKIYIFDGPPGCGKSTFLNNLLQKFQEYANGEAGMRFETVWHLDKNMLGEFSTEIRNPLLDKLEHLLNASAGEEGFITEGEGKCGSREDNGILEDDLVKRSFNRYLEIPCPCHDHPILMIPKKPRSDFLEKLFNESPFLEKLFGQKEYRWIFTDSACTICGSLFGILLERLRNPLDVFRMIYARPYRVNRRLGEGISVFTPGDEPMRNRVLSNRNLQMHINALLGDRQLMKYVFSRYAKTNNGIYALMDVKNNNVKRLIRLHNIISEGVHKVDDLEENIYSLFLAVMNPEDKKEVEDIQSLSDRIEYINISYVMDWRTEVEIYRGVFGSGIDKKFLPRVLNNFAWVIISSRLNVKSDALLEWIGNPGKYSAYCDKNLQLLKMELYAGNIPSWLSEEDRKEFTAKRRRKVISESEAEGRSGFSGRDSIKIFNEFYSTYAKEDKLINMNMLVNYFKKIRNDLGSSIPEGFLDALVHMYDYTVLEEVKDSLYYYNEEQISNQIQNYLFSLNFELGTVEVCKFTNEKIEISEEFLKGIERYLLDGNITDEKRKSFRKETQQEYASQTLTFEMMVEGKALPETSLYEILQDRYVHNLKERVLDPFQGNENFRRAIKDYGEEDFKTYEKKIRHDVSYLIKNLGEKFGYTEKGAKEVCMYVVDGKLTEKFAQKYSFK